MFEVRQKPEMVERALLVRFCFDPREMDEAESLLEELGELVKTLGIEVVDSVLARCRDMHKKLLCGTGKADEIVSLARAHDCDVIVIDNGLAPSQQREWEKLADLCVIDREEVILDIFAKRAQTKEARLQVELARMQYALPRLARMWGHLDREGGSGGGQGGGAARGMGEKQIEVDRRLANLSIDRCKRELEQVRKQRRTQRKEREKLETPHAAIVGYTNAGKSTLLNALSGADVMAKDMLFATLDTTTRRIDLPDGQPLLLTDTVGFVRKLPHGLIESFKSTLEVAAEADLLVHVVDASAQFPEHQITAVHEVLDEIGAGNVPELIVFNKCDLADDDGAHLVSTHTGSVAVSALKQRHLDVFLRTLADRVRSLTAVTELVIPFDRGDVLAAVHREGEVVSTESADDAMVVRARLSDASRGRLSQFVRGTGDGQAWERHDRP